MESFTIQGLETGQELTISGELLFDDVFLLPMEGEFINAVGYRAKSPAEAYYLHLRGREFGKYVNYLYAFDERDEFAKAVYVMTVELERKHGALYLLLSDDSAPAEAGATVH